MTDHTTSHDDAPTPGDDPIGRPDTNGAAAASPADDPLARLAEAIGAVSPRWRRELATSVCGGRRARSALRAGLDLGVEAIYEGWALHFATSRVLRADASAAMRMLVGDWCYAAGLCEVAETGDLDAVGTLADLIADTAALATGATPTPDGATHADVREIRWDEALTDLGT